MGLFDLNFVASKQIIVAKRSLTVAYSISKVLLLVVGLLLLFVYKQYWADIDADIGHRLTTRFDWNYFDGLSHLPAQGVGAPADICQFYANKRVGIATASRHLVAGAQSLSVSNISCPESNFAYEDIENAEQRHSSSRHMQIPTAILSHDGQEDPHLRLLPAAEQYLLQLEYDVSTIKYKQGYGDEDESMQGVYGGSSQSVFTSVLLDKEGEVMMGCPAFQTAILLENTGGNYSDAFGTGTRQICEQSCIVYYNCTHTRIHVHNVHILITAYSCICNVRAFNE